MTIKKLLYLLVSKEIIDMLASLNLSCSYKKILSIRDSITHEVKEQMKRDNGIYIPSTVSPNKPLFFAIDNTDVQVNTPDGCNQLHGTVQVVFQEKDSEYTAPSTQISREKKKNHIGSSSDDGFYSVQKCGAPTLENYNYPDFSNIRSTDDLVLSHQRDFSWAVLSCFDEQQSNNIPTWAAFNSLDDSRIITKTNYCTLPLLHGTPTDWSNLYTSLKIVQGINVATTPDNKTIISLDLQLYTKCIQLQSKDEINVNFIFRMGKLHVMFAMFKVLGNTLMEVD